MSYNFNKNTLSFSEDKENRRFILRGPTISNFGNAPKSDLSNPKYTEGSLKLGSEALKFEKKVGEQRNGKLDFLTLQSKQNCNMNKYFDLNRSLA
jgi:hypothetical protein